MILPGLLFLFIPCLSCGNLVLCHSLLLIWGIWRSVGSVGQPFLNLHRHDSWISQLSWLTQTQFKYITMSCLTPGNVRSGEQTSEHPVFLEVVEGEWNECRRWMDSLLFVVSQIAIRSTQSSLKKDLKIGTPSSDTFQLDDTSWFPQLTFIKYVQGILCSQCPCKNRVLCSCERANFSSACHS